MLTHHKQIAGARRIVVKVGSSSITGENQAKLDLVVDAIAASRARGTEVALVTSGAIATGMPLLGITEKPADLPTSQALASVGQSRLIARYQHSLERHKLVAGQVLVTAGDLEHEETRENARRALDRLFELGVLPIVNENDTVATQEIRFGDNDRLAALVAVLLDADALILLSDVDGLYDKPPSQADAQRLGRIEFGQDLSSIEIGGVGTGVGTGGAVTKVTAARVATESGISVLLTDTDSVQQALAGEQLGTWFQAKNPSEDED